MSTIRTFLAVPLPGSIRKRLGQLNTQLKKAGIHLKWVDEGVAHLTVCFLGDIEMTRVAKACDAVHEGVAECESIELTLGGLGAFPELAKARVLWVGLHKGHQELIDLHHLMTDRFQDHGFAIDRGRYHPHVTLARVPGGRTDRTLADRCRPFLDWPIGDMIMNRLVLLSSDLQPTGPVYSTLAHFEL